MTNLNSNFSLVRDFKWCRANCEFAAVRACFRKVGYVCSMNKTGYIFVNLGGNWKMKPPKQHANFKILDS